MQHEEYFDRYFAMGILDHDVSDATVAAAVKSAICGDAAPITRLLVETAGDVRGLVLSKGTNRKNQPSTDEGRTRLAEVLASISNELPSDDSRPFSDQDQVLDWIADLLVELDEDTPPETVLAVIDIFVSVVIRIRVLRRVENKLEHAGRASPPAWHGGVTAHLVRESTADFLAHLKQGDAAATTAGVGYQVQFVLRHDSKRLRAGILQLLASQETDLSVLASRLVSVHTIAGIKPD